VGSVQRKGRKKKAHATARKGRYIAILAIDGQCQQFRRQFSRLEVGARSSNRLMT
jgi:hypothetical protein